jgi:hypothetical protein
VYRAPWATYSDTKAMCNYLTDLTTRDTERVIVVGDFNLPLMGWDTTAASYTDNRSETLLRCFANEQGLGQLAKQPTRENSLLDLVFVSLHLCDDSVLIDLPPIAGSDHSAQLLTVPCVTTSGASSQTIIDYQHLDFVLSNIIWESVFAGCITVNDYASSFTDTLLKAVRVSSYSRHQHRRPVLPRHIVQLLKKKRCCWRAAKLSGDYTTFKLLSRTAQSAIRQYRRNQEQRLVFRNNRKAFFAHVYNKCGQRESSVNLVKDGTVMSDLDTAEAFQQEFASNFSTYTSAVSISTVQALCEQSAQCKHSTSRGSTSSTQQ